MGKYSGKDAFAQMEAVLKTWADKSGLEHKWPAEAAAEASPEMMEMMGMDGMDAEAMMEGGDEMMMEGMEAMEGMGMEAMAAKMSLIAPDAFGDISGSTEIPKLLLSLMFIHPFFGDAVKA